MRISNLAILDGALIEPGPGLNVLTGETGAGKSIIVDAIALLLGGRASADLLRHGATRLTVEGRFDPAGADRACAGGSNGPGAAVRIRRELFLHDSLVRSRAFVNDRAVTLGALRAMGESLADLHGQQRHQTLLLPDGQRVALDRFAKAGDLSVDVAALYYKMKQLEAEHGELSLRVRERESVQRDLDEKIARIERVAPRVDEEQELEREESLLHHASEVAQLAGESFCLLSDDDDSALARLGAAGERLARLAAIDPAADRIRSLVEEARLAVEEASGSVRAYLDTDGLDPQRLELVAGRLAELADLKRIHNATVDEILHRLESLRSRRAALEDLSERLERLGSRVVESRERFLAAAAKLSRRRKEGARRLASALREELGHLAMEATRVKITVQDDPASAGPHGVDAITFFIAPNRGEALKPLNRIASGGELSRLMLAVRNAADAPGDGRTLVFDEIDSGIGGGVAETVGRRLARLARRHQILCVTHLPQIAVFADRHFHVSKKTVGARTHARVDPLNEQGRVAELARMLGGMPPATARRHAAALMGLRRGVQL
ncbi:MAG: DNA repair protein RecN [Acidobacteriota bacterium]